MPQAIKGVMAERSEGLRYVGLAADLPDIPDAAQTWVRPVYCRRLDELSAIFPQNCCLALGGGKQGFAHIDIVMRDLENSGYVALRASIDDYLGLTADPVKAETRLHHICDKRADFAGLVMGRPHIMGIVNVTPDSFSDGGRFDRAEQAIAHGRQLADDGATILDIGGESTRPGATPVSHDEEAGRILPVIDGLVRAGLLVSADTRHLPVMQAALGAGAQIINDISGFSGAGASQLMAKNYAAQPDASFAIAMHMKGTPQVMQDDPVYDFAPIEVFNVLADHIIRLEAAGLPRSHIAIDPGFGFGKIPAHNLVLMRWLSLFHGLGVPILIGVSRKSSIPKLVPANFPTPPSGYGKIAGERLGGGLALSIEAVRQGVQLIRTHDVAETYQAIGVSVQLA